MPNEVDHPDISLCFSLPNIINWSMISEERMIALSKFVSSRSINKTSILGNEIPISRQRMKEIMSGKFGEEGRKLIKLGLEYIGHEMKVKEIFQNTNQDIFDDNLLKLILVNFMEINQSNERFANNLISKNLHDLVNKTESFLYPKPFILANKKCFTLQVNHKKIKHKFNYNFLESSSGGSNHMIYIQFPAWNFSIQNTINIPYFQTYLHPPGSPLGQRLQWISFNDNHIKVIALDVSHARLLKFPYKSRCTNYIKDSVVPSQDECRHDCEKDKIKRTGKPIPRNIRAYIHDNASYGTMISHHDSISMECEEACKHSDCFSQKYTPRLVSEIQTNYRSILVTASKNPMMELETLPSMATFSFLTNSLATFGIWLGFSLLGFEKVITGFVLSKMKGKKRPPANNRFIRKTRNHFRTQS